LAARWSGRSNALLVRGSPHQFGTSDRGFRAQERGRTLLSGAGVAARR
jgi:hypothetical protein